MKLKLNSYSNTNHFFIAFLHAWFRFAMRRFVVEVKKQNCACEKAMKRAISKQNKTKNGSFFGYFVHPRGKISNLVFK